MGDILTRKKAKEYELIVWGYSKDTGCTYDQRLEWLKVNHPIIFNFTHQSAFCERYWALSRERGDTALCTKCPLEKSNACTLYQYNWATVSSIAGRITWALKIYNLVRRA